MSDESERNESEGVDDADADANQIEGSEDDANAIRALLRRAAPPADDVTRRPPSLLPAVQRKIRQRSRGKFFADGWSTSQGTVSYVLVSVAMLIVLAAAYLVLGPTGIR